MPSHYATSPRAQSLRPFRFPSDQILSGDSHSLFPLIKDKNFLSPSFPNYLDNPRVDALVATLHMDNKHYLSNPQFKIFIISKNASLMPVLSFLPLKINLNPIRKVQLQ